MGIVNGTSGDSLGFLLGIVNYSEKFTGVQLSALNWARKELQGVQIGFVNVAHKFKGVQFGAINVAEFADSGIQLGIVNVILQNKKFFGEFPKAVGPFFIIANWRFE